MRRMKAITATAISSGQSDRRFAIGLKCSGIEKKTLVRDYQKQSSSCVLQVPRVAKISYPVTSVPTFSPITTRFRLCSLKKSNTMIGILLSMQSENAVESITLSCFWSASR